MKPTTAKAKHPEGTKDIEILCRYESQWPPIHAKLGSSFEEQRAAGDITETKYQQLKVWESMCGLLEMEAQKCVSCPLCETLYRGTRISLSEFERRANALVEAE